MSIFGKILKTTLDLGIGVPVALVKDAATMGGVCTDQQDRKGEPYVASAVKRVAKDAGEVRDAVDKL